MPYLSCGDPTYLSARLGFKGVDKALFGNLVAILGAFCCKGELQV